MQERGEGISSIAVLFLLLTINHGYENFLYQHYPLHDNSIIRFFLCTLPEIKVYKSGIEQELKRQKYLDFFLKLTARDVDWSGRNSVK